MRLQPLFNAKFKAVFSIRQKHKTKTLTSLKDKGGVPITKMSSLGSHQTVLIISRFNTLGSRHIFFQFVPFSFKRVCWKKKKSSLNDNLARVNWCLSSHQHSFHCQDFCSNEIECSFHTLAFHYYVFILLVPRLLPSSLFLSFKSCNSAD